MTGIALRLRMNPFRLYAFAGVALGLGGVCRDAGAASSLFRGEKRAFAGESARLCQKS